MQELEQRQILLQLELQSLSKKKPNVAACGYHGWHDWYLSSNLSNRNNLNYHLTKNVKTAGVNTKLKIRHFCFVITILIDLHIF